MSLNGTSPRWMLDRIPSAKYNRLTMPEIGEKAQTTMDSAEKKSFPQSSKLGSTATLKGEWSCEEDVIIEGKFQGTIDSGGHDLYIEKQAVVKADIRGKNITILGKVTGNVTCSGKIMVGSDAKIIGDLSAPQVAIQEGAKFKGSIKMLPNNR